MENKFLAGTKTRENLMKAFAGESTARNRYCIFASVAEKEGHIKIAQIFRDTALNEKEHAEVFYKFLDGENVEIKSTFPSCYGDTKANLSCAAKYEEEEYSTLYPEFAQTAKVEGFEKISQAFLNIASIENHHGKRYLEFLDKLEKNTLFECEKEVEWTCSHCGFVVKNEKAPTKCAVCGKSQEYFSSKCNCL